MYLEWSNFCEFWWLFLKLRFWLNLWNESLQWCMLFYKRYLIIPLTLTVITLYLTQLKISPVTIPFKCLLNWTLEQNSGLVLILNTLYVNKWMHKWIRTLISYIYIFIVEYSVTSYCLNHSVFITEIPFFIYMKVINGNDKHWYWIHVFYDKNNLIHLKSLRYDSRILDSNVNSIFNPLINSQDRRFLFLSYRNLQTMLFVVDFPWKYFSISVHIHMSEFVSQRMVRIE